MRYCLRKLTSIVVVMAIVGLVVFMMLRLAPGDPAAILAGDNATVEQIAQVRQSLGLDDPVPQQFVRWSLHVLEGDLGKSIFSGSDVSKLILQRLEPTLSLSLVTMLLCVPIAIALGVLAAARVGSIIDRVVMTTSVLGFSVPGFVSAYFLIYVFAVRLSWLPVQGYSPIADGVLPWLRGLVLPSLVLSLAYIALIARITRATVLDVLAEDYIRTARAKGVKPNGILFGHALRNAGVPIATVVGLGFSLLIGGVVITETVFNIPGIGRLVVDAITKRDYPIIQGVTLVLSGVYIVVNLAVDLSYGLIDPRMRTQ